MKRKESQYAVDTPLTAREIRRELRALGWKVKKGAWASPHTKIVFQHLTLAEAASHELLLASEILPTV